MKGNLRHWKDKRVSEERKKTQINYTDKDQLFCSLDMSNLTITRYKKCRISLRLICRPALLSAKTLQKQLIHLESLKP